jgi:hypothetical protein
MSLVPQKNSVFMENASNKTQNASILSVKKGLDAN